MIMAARKCEQCGKEFTAQRSTARFCCATCRVAWNRNKKQSSAEVKILALPKPKQREHAGGSHTKAQAEQLADVDTSGTVEASTREKFDELGVNMASPDVAVTLTVAKRIDHNMTETGAALKSLVSAWQESYDRVIGSVPAKADPLDELKAKRDELTARARG